MTFHVVPPLLLSFKSFLSQILPFLVSSVNVDLSHRFICYCKVFVKSLSFVHIVSGDGVRVVDLSGVDVPLKLAYSLSKSVLLNFLLVFHGGLDSKLRLGGKLLVLLGS